MLKIKDDVDWRELERFGFEYNCEEECYGDPSEEYYEEYFYSWYELKSNNGDVLIKIENDYKIYLFENFYKHIDEILNVLFDIIQTGLVEKG